MCTSSLRLPWLFILAVAAAPLLVSQQAPPEPSVTFKTSAQEVSLDVVVRDAKGKIVKNLTRDEIEVYEDGVRQDIREFRFVPGREVLSSHAESTPASAKAAVVLPKSIVSVNVVCLIFHGLDPYTKKNASDFAREFVQNNVQSNTWVGMFSLDENLTTLHEFSNDKTDLIRAINSAHTGTGEDFLSAASLMLNASPNISTISENVSGSGSSTSVTSTMDITGGEVNLRAINGADVSTGTGANRVRGDQADARRQFTSIAAHRNFDSLNLLVDQLQKLPGHKSVLLLSTGLVGLDDPDRFSALTKRAAKADITFYAVDVTGLDQNSSTLAGNTALSHATNLSQMQRSTTTSASQNMERMRQDDYVNQGVRQSNPQAVMRELSEATGGFLIANTNDLRKPFQRVLEDLNAHYEAIYHPTETKYDAHLRTIEVKVKHPDWTVDSRAGYYAMPALGNTVDVSPAEMVGLAALNVKPVPHAFPFDSAAMHFRPTATGLQQAIAFELPVMNLAVTTEPDVQKYRIHASVLILVKDSNGEVVDKYSQDSPFEFPDGALKQAAQSTLDFTHPVALPEGHYTAEVAVVDQEAKRASVIRFAFFNPARKPLGVSSVTLVQRVEPVSAFDPADPFELAAGANKYERVIPEIRNTLRKDSKPLAYFVVYPNKNISEKPKLQVELIVNGKLLAKQVSDLSTPAPDGSIPMLVGTALSPGDCELKITAVQGEQSATESLHYSVNP